MRLPCAEYVKAYRNAKAAYEAEVMAAKAAAELLGVEEATKPKKQSNSQIKKAAQKVTKMAAEAAAREKAEHEAAAAFEAARAAEIAAAEAAAREKAEREAAVAKEAERRRLAAVSLALVAAQREPLPLEKALGVAAPATLPRTYIGSRELNPENRYMLSDLIHYDDLEHIAAPVRTYDWDQLTHLLGNLGFKRQGTNFVGFDGTGKCKQIGLHYLHGDMSLNPHLIKIMFKQLHASVGWGREAIGRLAGIGEKLTPWPWEPDPQG